MNSSFSKPDFSNGAIEIRVEGDEVSIYANPDGLRWLAKQCIEMAERKREHHIHIEEYQILTPASKRATIALFLG